MFRVGQKVVAIRNHSQGYFVMGQTFTVRGLRCCPLCGSPDVDVGIINDKKSCQCDCGYFERTDYAWFNEFCFAPIEEISETTYEEIMEQFLVPKKIDIN